MRLSSNDIPQMIELSQSSKFYTKSLTLMISILQMIKEGYIAADIARTLHLKKSHVSYYIKKAKLKGYVKEVTRDVFIVLELTQAGKNFLDQYDKNNLLPICRAENIQFKAEIIQMPIVPVDWKKIQMHNWVQYTSQIDSVKVRLNMGKIPTLELLSSPVDGDDPFELYTTLVYECLNVLQNLSDRIGLRVGKLHLSSRGEWSIYDPVARGFCKHNGQVTYDGIGKVNASKPRNIGEFEFHDPRALLEYMLMPQRVKNIETLLQQLLDTLIQLGMIPQLIHKRCN